MQFPTGQFEVQPSQPSFTDEVKTAFGKAINTYKTSFEAACSIWWDTPTALWAAKFLVNDPVVQAAKVAGNTSENLKILDRQQLAAKLLDYADELDPSGRFRTVDHKDRLAYLRLYAELQGFVGKVEFNPTQINNNTTNVRKIVFVKPSNNNEPKIIEATVEQVAPITTKLKLVGGGTA